MHNCELLSEALAATPPLLRRAKNTITIPVHDGDGPGCLGRSGINIFFCPWSGEPLADVDRSITSAGQPHACELITYYLNLEDLVIVYDGVEDLFLFPVFDGSPEDNCLGSSGVRLPFCPWCGASFPVVHSETEALTLADLRRPLPIGVRSPRR